MHIVPTKGCAEVVMGNTSQSCGASPPIMGSQSVTEATRLNPSLLLDWPTREGWKAALTWAVVCYIPS